MQEQQLRARQLVLQQQAASAVMAASKTQREVYVGNLMPGLVTADMLRQLFDSTMAAAFPDKVEEGAVGVCRGWECWLGSMWWRPVRWGCAGWVD